MDWDDLKIFLEVARIGSVRGAASTLNVNQSTVSRRITNFEKSLGTALFEKHPTGYVITPAGEDIRRNVERMEEEVAAIDRKLFRRQPALEGSLRVALPVPLATNMLMPDIKQFCQDYPNIELDLAISSGTTNLSKREADVAVRIIKVGETPPDYLVGRKLATYATSHYIARSRTQLTHPWIGFARDNSPSRNIKYAIDDVTSQIEAVKAGIGVAELPCCLADTDTSLIRIPHTLAQGREIWLLTHLDLKNTPRVKVFLKFIRDTFNQHQDLLQGHKPHL